MAQAAANQMIDKTSALKPGAPGAFFVALALFILINLGVYAATRHAKAEEVRQLPVVKAVCGAKGRSFSWWTASSYLKEPAMPDLVLIGSSQMGSATFAADAQLLHQARDVLTMRRAAFLESCLSRSFAHPVSVFNCSQGGFMASDAYMLSRAMFNPARKPKLVVIGIGPRDFMDNSVTSAASTEPFQFYAQCVDPGALAAHAFANALEHFQWFASHDLPLRMFEQSLVLQKVQDQPSAMPHHRLYQNVQALFDVSGDLEPGKLLIPANIPPILMDNTREYEHRFQNPNPPLYQQEMAFFQGLLSYLRKSKITVLVVGMPSLWPNRELLPTEFWQSFHRQIKQLCQAENAEWMDLSDSEQFRADDYLDTVHLNASGGAILFKTIAAKITNDHLLN